LNIIDDLLDAGRGKPAGMDLLQARLDEFLPHPRIRFRAATGWLSCIHFTLLNN